MAVANGGSPVSTPGQRIDLARYSTPWLLVSVLSFFYIFSFIDRATIAMLVDPIRQDLELSDTQISLLVGAAFGLSYGFAAIPMGWLVDRVPRRWIVFVAVNFWGLSTAACGLAGNFWHMFAARMGVGLGEAPLNPAAHSMISDAFPRERLATAISVFTMGALIGSGLSFITGGLIVELLLNYPGFHLPIIGEVASWQMVFMAIGAPGVLLSLLILLLSEPRRRLTHMERSKPGSWAALYRFMTSRWKVLTCFIFVFGGMQIVNGAFIWWQPAYLSRYFKMTPAEYGLMLGLITAVAGVAGLLFSGWTVDKLYQKGFKDAHMRYYFWALLVSTPVTLFAVLSDSVRVYFSLIWVAKFLMINFTGFASAMIQLITPPELRGRMSAVFINIVLGFGGNIFGPLVPAMISDYVLKNETELGRAFALTIMLIVPIALAVLWFGRKWLWAAVVEAESWDANAQHA